MGVQAGETTPSPSGLLKDTERLKQNPQLQEHIKAFWKQPGVITFRLHSPATSGMALVRPPWVTGTMGGSRDDDLLLSSLQVTRAIHELLLVPSQRSEVQTVFASLFVALLFQISFLVTNRSTLGQDKPHETECVNLVRYLGPWAGVLGTMICIPAAWHPR